jgi:hypothetical protein
MADQLDQLRKQIDDLNKRVAALGGEFFRDVDKAIDNFGGGVKGAESALRSLRKEMDSLNTDTNYFYETLKKVTAELKGQKSFNKDITKSYSNLSSIANKLKYDQDGISELSKKELQSLIKKIGIQRTELKNTVRLNEEESNAANFRKNLLENEFENLSKLIDKRGYVTKAEEERLDQIAASYLKEENLIKKIGNANDEALGILNDEEFGLRKLEQVTEERLRKEIKINKTLGISGKIIDSIVGTLGKLGISSDFFENLKDDMRDAAKSGSKWSVLMTGIKGIVSGVGEALRDPVTQLTIALKILNFFVKAALTANAQSVELGKQLGYGADRANDLRGRFVDIEASTNNLNVTTKNLTEAFGQLVQATGFAYEFTADQLNTQIKLTKQVGLQADEAAQIQRFSILTGQSSEETYRSFVRGLTATRNQLRVGINFKATLAEAAKISGQLAANLGFNPEIIARAVVQAKAFGMTLEQTAKAGDALLNFESSIENELKAELLTGKQLNLERARAAALAGDQITLAEELNKNIGTAAEFTRMNRLQQNALAQSVGMTSDELAETLRKREEALASGKSLVQIQEEEAREALERQNIQDKFNAAVEKLQSLFGNLMAGPLGSFIDMLSTGLNLINSMITPLKVIGGIYLGYVATKKIALGYDIAANSAARINQSLGQSIAATNLVKNQLEKQSLLTRIAGNIQLFRQLTAEHGVEAALKIQFGLQKATNVEKNKGLLITMKDWLYEKGKTLWLNLQKTGTIVLNALKGIGANISKKEAIFSIANAAMDAMSAAVSGIGKLLGPLAIPIGLAAAVGVGALGYNLLKGDDVMSEGGYGKRTLLAPEGAIKLNDNDTVIAGTKLMDSKPKGLSPQINSPLLNVPSKIQMPQINLEPMIAAIDKVNASVDKLYNKDQSIYMGVAKVGTTMVQNSYKVA